MSIGFVFVLLGISELTPAGNHADGLRRRDGAMSLAALNRRPAAVQVLFSVSAVAVSLMLAYECSQLGAVRNCMRSRLLIVLAVATCLYFLSNSLLVSGVLSLVKREPLRAIWQQCYLYAFPYYLLGGRWPALMAASGRELGWKPPLLILPVMGLAFLFYRFYLARLAMQPIVAAAGSSLHTVKTRSA